MADERLFIDRSTLEEIGNAIRAKKGTTALIPVPNLASEILSIEGGGTTVGEWVSGKTYNVGDIVTHEGSVYRLINALPAWEVKPDITSDVYWERLNTYVYEEAYSPIACYKVGTIAKYNGSVYLCIQDEPNMGFYPDQNPEYWEKLND